MSFKKIIMFLFMFSGLFIFSGQAEESAYSIDDDTLFEMSLEELMVQTVVSSSRQEQKITESSVPIAVITAEDIHYSGLTNLYEVLQFAAGIDMAQIDRNQYAMGVRGLHESFSDRTLTLIDGRPADSPIFGGSQFLKLPLLLEDIERIEVVRGPVGSAWGANAFNGLINIITKKPAESKGIMGSTQFNHFGDNYHYLRYADAKDAFSWRISSGYESQETSSDALTDERFLSISPLSGGYFESRDFRRGYVIDSDFVNKISDSSTLSFGFGYSFKETGDFSFAALWPMLDGFWENASAYAKLEKEYDDDRKGFLQWTGNYSNQKWPSMFQWQGYENDIQAQYQFKTANGHNITVGGSLTVIRLDQPTVMQSSDLIFDGKPVYEQDAGLFVVDRFSVTEKLDLEVQARGQWYSETHCDWAGRISTLYSLDDAKHHVIRFSAARAFRAPRTSLRQLKTDRVPLGGGAYLIQIFQGGNLDNEEICSFEAGYTGILSKKMILKANAYWQRYKDLIGYVKRQPFPSMENHTPENIGGARACGGELELEHKTDKYSLSAWYGYNRFIPNGDMAGDNPSHDVRSLLPAEHKVGLTGRLWLNDTTTMNLNYKYSSTSNAQHGPGTVEDTRIVDQFHRVDITIAKEFQIDGADGELMFGVADIANQTEQKAYAMGRFYGKHETPGRTFFGRIQLKF